MRKSNFSAYWASISKEMESVRSRFQDIIAGKHNLSEGTYKELLLRNAIKRHLPESFDIHTGFVCTDQKCSNQIDLLVIDRSGFTLFKEGDLLIVTPSAVRAIIEVKTRMVSRKQIKNDLLKLAKNANFVEQAPTPHSKPFWAGLFCFVGGIRRAPEILEAVGSAYSEANYPIDCVAFGTDVLVMKNMKQENGQNWLAFRGKNLAAGGFITALIGNITKELGFFDSRILFSSIFEDKARPIYYIKQGQEKASPTESR